MLCASSQCYTESTAQRTSAGSACHAHVAHQRQKAPAVLESIVQARSQVCHCAYAPHHLHTALLVATAILIPPYRRRCAYQTAATSSAASIEPSFPEPVPARSQLDKVADVLTTLFPVWVGTLACLHGMTYLHVLRTSHLSPVVLNEVASAGVSRGIHWHSQARISSLVQQWSVHKSAGLPHAFHGSHTYL